MMDVAMVNRATSPLGKFAAPNGWRFRALIQIMSGRDGLARMGWPGLRFSVMPTI
jgi:hypothetical protein